MTVYIKQGSNIKELHIILIKFLGFLAKEINEDMFITSGNDGDHMKHSLHYFNRAVDFGINCSKFLFVKKLDEFCEKNNVNRKHLQFYRITDNGKFNITYYHVEWDEFGKYVEGNK